MSNSLARKMKKHGQMNRLMDNQRKILNALRSTAVILKQYATGSNWALVGDRSIWIGEGDGPELAEKALGIKRDEKKDVPSFAPISEGKKFKGGVNEPPTEPRPATPPLGQGG